jgi:hypothetical protein
VTVFVLNLKYPIIIVVNEIMRKGIRIEKHSVIQEKETTEVGIVQ